MQQKGESSKREKQRGRNHHRTDQFLHWRVPHNTCGQMLPDVCNLAEPLEVEYRRSIHQSSDQSNSGRKEKVKPPCGKETEGQELRLRRDY